ncbi:MAG TPA: lipopolysaccharide biosynthesis protein [Sphingomonas sp.]|jgi:capsular polysaccharide transport system permease protein
MNAHGFMMPAQVDAGPRASWRERLVSARRSYGWFIAVVILPLAVIGTYLYAFASDQYVSEAHYLVRSQDAPKASAGGLSGLLGGAGAALGGVGEAASVSDYLTSHDVVNSLRRSIDLVAIFRRPEADAWSRLAYENPTPEALLKFYRSQVSVEFDSETGITELHVRAFRPQDANLLARSLLALGEQRVNYMNERAFRDAVELSRRQLQEATRALTRVQAQVTAFRQEERDINPTGSAEAQLGLVTQLTAQLAAARSQRDLTSQLIGTRNPQYEALNQQVRSLETQVGAQSGRLTGGSGTIAADLGNYERLRIEQELLAKRYDAASSAYELARQQAVRQQLYLTRIVDPNMPVKSLYPKRGVILLTMLAALLVIYGIGWLIAAGVREHAA